MLALRNIITVTCNVCRLTAVNNLSVTVEKWWDMFLLLNLRAEELVLINQMSLE
jgi:hypothetical protein